MSTITKVWTEEKFRFVLINLDKKTGLSGAKLEIKLTDDDESIASFCCNGRNTFFKFNISRFNDPKFKELAAIETIRHEYAHYYSHAVELKKWIYDSRHLGGHEKSWEYACKMIEIEPKRYYNSEYYADKDITVAQARSLIYAEDIETINVLEYIRNWNNLPLKKQEHKEGTERLKENFPHAKIFSELDVVEHFLFGKGFVVQTRPEYNGQRVLVLFFDKGYQVVKANILKAA